MVSNTEMRAVTSKIDQIFFATPEQKLIRFLLSAPTSSFTPRVLSSKLKGVRGLGGPEGIQQILLHLKELEMVDFVNQNRAVRLNEDHLAVKLLKVFASVCDMEGVTEMVSPISSKGILFGSRATGECRTDSDYDLFVVSDCPDEVEKTVLRHPLGKQIEVVTWAPKDYLKISQKDPALLKKLNQGIVMWGSVW